MKTKNLMDNKMPNAANGHSGHCVSRRELMPETGFKDPAGRSNWLSVWQQHRLWFSKPVLH